MVTSLSFFEMRTSCMSPKCSIVFKSSCTGSRCSRAVSRVLAMSNMFMSLSANAMAKAMAKRTVTDLPLRLGATMTHILRLIASNMRVISSATLASGNFGSYVAISGVARSNKRRTLWTYRLVSLPMSRLNIPSKKHCK